ncbi:hypothetical protein PANT_22d00161 [Moesziomyces antarcticus T-34]|uniref:Uncharacterized protein n=1 Tax=Pseudozyma antarctica (strain T-34) TaxID=1151754 RepID=M9M705_PSEA3|nr:hypothetical protein PANT_22d00161 [Moesziomyces antarcticus T-34]
MRASAHPTLLLRLTWLDVDVVAKATSDVLVFTRASALGQQTSAKSFFSPRLAPSRRDGGGRAQATSQCVALRLPCKRESCYTPLLGTVAATVGEDAHGRANALLHERNDKRVPANPFATAPVPALLFAGLSARG